ncbi:MAG: hypothetical protein ACOYL8_03755 [Patescibacteria group bacterium]
MNSENSINKIKKGDYVFTSKKSTQDCLAILESSLTVSLFDPLTNLSSEKSLKPIFFGTVKGNSFSAQYITPFFRNDFRPIFFGHIESEENGTLVHGNFSRGNKILYRIGCAIYLFVFFILVFQEIYIFLPIVTLMVVVWTLLLKLTIGGGDKKKVLDFLKSELQLEEKNIY